MVKKIHPVKTFLFFILLLFSFNISESSAISVCQEPVPGTFIYDNTCPIAATPINCTTLDTVIDALCPAGWTCLAPSCPATCDFGGPGCGGTNCVNEYEACGCFCGGVPALPSGGGGGSTAGCVGGVPDSTCDESAGETIFNCTDDCLDPGIPRVPFDTILERLIEWTLGFGLAIAVTFLIWSGVVYTSSSGDAQKAENAKKVMKYAILGVLVIGISYAIITVLNTIFT